jgi:hypothetical protein
MVCCMDPNATLILNILFGGGNVLPLIFIVVRGKRFRDGNDV